ncbi:MAG: fructose-bisphosphate aldolase, class [Blastocatellia bacterium]|jgi:fructose-bisphosphate aldolase class I|nr:fructose-bisphosphate aldolase, class [Blastocatellia bacterium]
MKRPELNNEQLRIMKTRPGFVAALDESGGSTPKTLAAYGIPPGSWSNDDQMFALVHQMRTRVMTSPVFTGDRIVGAILFEDTMDRNVNGKLSADYLWEVKRVVPFLKVDKGLAEEKDGVQLMKPIPSLGALLNKAKGNRIFGTKMRSLIHQANADGTREIVAQQFELASQIIAAELVPIIEPEISIKCPDKAHAEELLKAGILEKLNKLAADELVFLKLTLPEKGGLYSEFVAHRNVIRVLALSGGYSREEADDRLHRNRGVIASFSRALLEGLSVDQSDSEFDAALDNAIESIFEASTMKNTSTT